MCWGCAGGLCHFFVFSLICQRHIKKEVLATNKHLKYETQGEVVSLA